MYSGLIRKYYINRGYERKKLTHVYSEGGDRNPEVLAEEFVFSSSELSLPSFAQEASLSTA